MANQHKGGVVIRNSAGAINLKALGNITNSATSAGWKDASTINILNDATNTPLKAMRDYTEYEMTLSVTMGLGQTYANIAALTAAFASVRKMDPIIMGSEAGLAFQNPNLECPASYKAVIWEIGQTQSVGDTMKMDITVHRWCSVSGAIETAIDFTGAWANIA